ncbi:MULTISPECIES: N-acetylmuramoyl-L-alanine amidase [Streptomyces]|uniref:N-acetylmuramoyl-L-alanine amidase n=1 Tax=Streptomyces dengpaensis TaxID=2049881 RepID=A0ABM6T019_9ACTN|nr:MULTISPECIES: N-acetylmuramoyl-L-alanine amidase [Streptomyces]AVH60023.1 N-acetylmuramoyl-L-alanine amidase [Streptomyces dengpaensis]PIB09661.1 hypothetical protein B1C81_10970 [Streptomyces sp. HG99]
MAAPLSPDRLLAVLHTEGVNAREYKNWRTHNRDDETGRPFGPVNGIVIHHTAGTNSLALCYNGTPDLPGPLCHTHLDKTGVATMLSAGRANHAGSFAQNAHDAVVAESSTHPRPDAAEPVDANDKYYGIEIENLGNGNDPYPAAQYDAAVRWAAGICRAHGWSADSVIGHKEGTRRKIDPSFDMHQFRTDVAARLAHTADWNPDEEDDMPTANEVAKAVLTYDGVIAVPGAPATNPTWTLSSSVTEILKRQDKANATLAAQKATIDELVKAVATLAAGIGNLDPAAIVRELTAAIEAIDIHLDVPDAS